MSSEYSIEIDCAPGLPRPDTHFNNMCEICELDISWFKSPTKFFGNWEWKVNPEYNSQYIKKQKEIQTYLTDLYIYSNVRYASW